MRNIEDWLFRYQEGLLSEPERHAVEGYLAAHPETQAMLQSYDPHLRLPKEMPLTNQAGQPLTYPNKEALKHPKEILAKASKKTHTRRLISHRFTWAAAACAAAILAVGITFITHFGSPLPSASAPIAQVQQCPTAPQPQPQSTESTGPEKNVQRSSQPAQRSNFSRPTEFSEPTEPAEFAESPSAPAKSPAIQPTENSCLLIAYVEEPDTPTDSSTTLVSNLIAYQEPSHNILHRIAAWTGLGRSKELSRNLQASGDILNDITDAIASAKEALHLGPKAIGEYAYAYIIGPRHNDRRLRNSQ